MDDCIRENILKDLLIEQKKEGIDVGLCGICVGMCGFFQISHKTNIKTEENRIKTHKNKEKTTRIRNFRC